MPDVQHNESVERSGGGLCLYNLWSFVGCPLEELEPLQLSPSSDSFSLHLRIVVPAAKAPAPFEELSCGHGWYGNRRTAARGLQRAVSHRWLALHP